MHKIGGMGNTIVGWIIVKIEEVYAAMKSLEPIDSKWRYAQQEGIKQPQLVYTKLTYKRKKRTKNNQVRIQKRKLWLSGITAVAFLLLLWGWSAEGQARYTPVYEMVNIEEYLYKEELSQEEYILLFRQTGLARVAVDALRAEGREEELLTLQEKFFEQVPVECEANTIISREERIVGNSIEEDSVTISAERTLESAQDRYVDIPYVENGDILITFNCHVFGWRNGHAAMVVDAEKGLTLEARVLGTDSAIISMEHWKQYPSFVILRLKNVEQAQRAKIAEYAQTQMTGMPYRLTAGWGDWMYPEALTKGTHCAHLVWSAYHAFGYDLDSDGGMIVTPHDLYESDLLEFVQVYGMPISAAE